VETIIKNRTYPFLQGGGAMGEMIRNYDWSCSALGDPDQWPQSLRISLGNVLNSGFPMFLFWGEDLTCFYNDAFRPSLGIEGKHPAIGKEGRVVWKEIWDFIGPLISGVMSTGKPVWFEDQLVPFYRNGGIEDIYWTFSYSLILNDDGDPGGVLVTCMETTNSVLTHRKLEENEQNLRKVILQAPVAICILDGTQFLIDIINPAMCALMGRDASALEHIPLFDAMPEVRSRGLEEILQGVLDTGVTYVSSEQEFQLPRQGSLQTVYVKYIYEPLLNGKGEADRIMALAIDVTPQVLARQKIEEVVAQRTSELAMVDLALLQANTELKRSNANLEEFAHAASHDMKEPIRKIRFFTQRLREQLLPQLQESDLRFFARIEDATGRMGTLIDDLLLYSHFTQLPHETAAVNLNEKIDRVLEDLELIIEEKKAVIRVGKLPVIMGYRRQLQQLFQNLIANAIKYSREEAAPQIDISAELTVDGGRKFHVITVADNGIGFEEQYAEKIFQMFSRLHGRNEYSGNGVGLSIARKVVENHQGSIRVRSTIGAGSTFMIYLPADGSAGGGVTPDSVRVR
jgi:PAS domain S-box-containing protein